MKISYKNINPYMHVIKSTCSSENGNSSDLNDTQLYHKNWEIQAC